MTRRYRSAILSILIALVCMPMAELSAQPAFAGAKRELRGVWIASILNYDWPVSPSLTPQQQRDSLILLLDLFAASGFNAVFFQVRPECDALYPSALEPWSYWLTGAQGTGPSPAYDPLAFAVEEAHKRGMELHAWFNPYRAYRQDVSYTRAPTHVIEQHPDWIITCTDGFRQLNPGLQEVRDRVSAVVSDVVRRYAIDGIHFDDYFYPYPEHGFTKQDSATWAADPRGFAWDSVAYWRRDNVNRMVRQVYDSVQALKPWVKFGVSPFGIWKPNVPVGISGLSAYNDIFCDPTAWLQGQYVDYVVPQLYWGFGGGQDYSALQAWWASQGNGRHVYTGNAVYKIGLSGWPATEIANQIRHNQSTGAVQGAVLFRAYNLRTNDGGIVGTLTSDVFRFPAIVPPMTWKETVPPSTPSGLQMTYNSGSGQYALTWQKPAAAADGDTAVRYIVYRFTAGGPNPADMEIARNMIAITGETETIPRARIDSSGTYYYYAVSALDKNNNESGLSNVVSNIMPLSAPTLLSPAAGSMTYAKGDPLVWQGQPSALIYRVQMDSTGAFAEGQMLLNALVADTTIRPAGLLANKTYYWRVIAGNQTGESTVAATRSFTTGWLPSPTLLSPLNKINVARLTTFVWASSNASSYRLRVIDNSTQATVLDTTTADTSLTCATALDASKIFLWYVLAVNPYGDGDWSAEGRFRTGTALTGVSGETEEPAAFALEQNWPNPFNPTTTIGYSVAGVVAPSGAILSGVEGRASSNVRLAVYDLLGREVAVLVDEQKRPGEYTAKWDAQGMASGMYFYRLTAGSFVQTRKMILTK